MSGCGSSSPSRNSIGSTNIPKAHALSGVKVNPQFQAGMPEARGALFQDWEHTLAPALEQSQCPQLARLNDTGLNAPLLQSRNPKRQQTPISYFEFRLKVYMLQVRGFGVSGNASNLQASGMPLPAKQSPGFCKLCDALSPPRRDKHTLGGHTLCQSSR